VDFDQAGLAPRPPHVPSAEPGEVKRSVTTISGRRLPIPSRFSGRPPVADRTSPPTMAGSRTRRSDPEGNSRLGREQGGALPRRIVREARQPLLAPVARDVPVDFHRPHPIARGELKPISIFRRGGTDRVPWFRLRPSPSLPADPIPQDPVSRRPKIPARPLPLEQTVGFDFLPTELRVLASPSSGRGRTAAPNECFAC
jgi:hypothetical protein